MSTLILGGIVGLLLGLIWCYWKQIRAVYDNKNLISTGSDLADAATNFYGELQKKF